MNRFIIALFYLILPLQQASPPTGEQVLARAIRYHDPGGRFLTSKHRVTLEETRPTGSDRQSTVTFDYPNSRFQLIQKIDGRSIAYDLQGESVTVTIDGSAEISAADSAKFRLTAERAFVLRDYCGYLYGLPMKLRDAGTIISDDVQVTEFDDQPVYALKVTYDEKVGSDTWYFYFDRESFALAGYRFYHDESKNDGEYILLAGEVEAEGIRLPKARKWYRHGDGQFLGTDTIVELVFF